MIDWRGVAVGGACAALVAVAALVHLGGEAAAPDPPAGASGPAPADPAALEADLAILDAVRERIDRDPVIRAATGIQDPAGPRVARENWSAARERLASLLQHEDVTRAMRRLSRAPPSTAAVSAVAALHLRERLFGWSRWTGEAAVLGESRRTRFARYLAHAVEVRPEPAMDGRPIRSTLRASIHYRRELAREGRRWRLLRSVDELYVSEGPARGINSRVRIQDLEGDPFADPVQDVPGVLSDQLYSALDRTRLRLAPIRIELPLEEPSADLYLALVVWDLGRSVLLELEVVGADDTLRLVATRPHGGPASAGPPDSLPGVLTLRVRRQVLPAGVRKLRLRAVALPGSGSPSPTIHLTEILQHVGGPPPASFADHRWGHPRELPQELDGARQAALQGRLQALGSQLQARPADPDLWLELGAALREGGQLEAAVRALARARDLRPEHAATWNRLGEAHWSLGDREAASRAFWRSYWLDPQGRGRELLQRHAPEELRLHRVIEDPEEFAEVAELLRDFRRQAEIERALTEFALRKGVRLRLTPENSLELVGDLHRRGYLDRPDGPPSGRGRYVTDDRGRVTSTEYGSRRAPSRSQAALVAPRGFRVTAAAILAAAPRSPAAAEVGLHLLEEGAFLDALTRLAPSLVELRDPSVDAVVLERLRRRPAGELPPPVGPVADLLRRILDGPDETSRGVARGLLARCGARALPELPAERIPDLLAAVQRGAVPEEAAISALDARGAAAREQLLGLLQGPRQDLTAAAARLLPRYARPTDARALVRAAGASGAAPHRAALWQALRQLTGREDLPLDPARWGEIVEGGR